MNRIDPDSRTPPSGGSGVTREMVPDGIPIGRRPSAPCRHDYVFLRSEKGYGPRDPANADVFYCRHCLEYQTVTRG